MIRAAELRGTMNTQGWKVVVEVDEAIAREFEAKVMACDDEEQIIRLQRKAQAAREIISERQRRLDAITHIEPAETIQSVAF